MQDGGIKANKTTIANKTIDFAEEEGIFRQESDSDQDTTSVPRSH